MTGWDQFPDFQEMGPEGQNNHSWGPNPPVDDNGPKP